MKEYYVYTLINPITEQMFYIGKGKKQRAWMHLTEHWDKHNPGKSLEIRKIRRQGKEPIVKILHENLEQQEALDVEADLIKKYGRRNFETYGILTNLTKGGYGGDTSEHFTEESYKKMSRPGIKNPRAKLTEKQVLDIYYSCEKTQDLVDKYGVVSGQIMCIKRKKSYKNVTENIIDMPGVHPSCKRIPLSTETIQDIYLDEGDTAYFKEVYNVGIGVVRNIKFRNTYKKETEGLGVPGEISLWGLTETDIDDIYESKEPRKELAKKYGVDPETIRNIQLSKTRAFV